MLSIFGLKHTNYRYDCRPGCGSHFQCHVRWLQFVRRPSFDVTPIRPQEKEIIEYPYSCYVLGRSIYCPEWCSPGTVIKNALHAQLHSNSTTIVPYVILQCKDGVSVSDSNNVTSTADEASFTILTLYWVQQLRIWWLLIRYGGRTHSGLIFGRRREFKRILYSLHWWYVLNVSQSLRLISHLAL